MQEPNSHLYEVKVIKYFVIEEKINQLQWLFEYELIGKKL